MTKPKGFFARFKKKQPSQEGVCENKESQPKQTFEPETGFSESSPFNSEESEQSVDVPVEETSFGPDPIADLSIEPKKKFFLRLKEGLSKTRNSLKQKLGGVFAAGRKIDEDLYDELEEMLISSDLGVQTTHELIEKVRKTVARKQLHNGGELKKEIKKILLETFEKQSVRPFAHDQKPMIALIVGVNGVGKTTTIGKMATFWKNQGKRVLICAADTFRAAAVEQLQVWAERADVEIVLKEDSKDPASVVFDALARARQGDFDILLIDTAGRLHNNPGLMKELEKIHKIIGREYENAPHHVFLILDAVTGQNGLQQAKQFVSKVSVSDLVITKLDGTAKGGVAVSITNELNLPVRFIGVGEHQNDLLAFDPVQFVNSLFDDTSGMASVEKEDA